MKGPLINQYLRSMRINSYFIAGRVDGPVLIVIISITLNHFSTSHPRVSFSASESDRQRVKYRHIPETVYVAHE